MDNDWFSWDVWTTYIEAHVGNPYSDLPFGHDRNGDLTVILPTIKRRWSLLRSLADYCRKVIRAECFPPCSP